MLAKEYRLINITEFMEMIRKDHFNSEVCPNQV